MGSRNIQGFALEQLVLLCHRSISVYVHYQFLSLSVFGQILRSGHLYLNTGLYSAFNCVRLELRPNLPSRAEDLSLESLNINSRKSRVGPNRSGSRSKLRRRWFESGKSGHKVASWVAKVAPRILRVCSYQILTQNQ